VGIRPYMHLTLGHGGRRVLPGKSKIGFGGGRNKSQTSEMFEVSDSMIDRVFCTAIFQPAKGTGKVGASWGVKYLVKSTGKCKICAFPHPLYVGGISGAQLQEWCPKKSLQMCKGTPSFQFAKQTMLLPTIPQFATIHVRK
jgi:hypothetical protein